jgi:uncharacterized protein YdhG (YjbR/CyaY superfamily)
MTETKMLVLADQLKELRDRKSELDFEIKELNEHIDDTERELIEEMTTEEIETFKRNGVMFVLVKKEFPSAVPERKAELYDVMKEQGFEHLFTINAQTLSATLKELKANNDEMLPEWLEGLVKTTEKASIQVRKK